MFLFLEQLLEPLSRQLGVPLEVVVIFNIDNAEPGCVSQKPFKVVEYWPCMVSYHIGSIIDRLQQLRQIAPVVIDSCGIMYPLRECHIARIIHTYHKYQFSANRQRMVEYDMIYQQHPTLCYENKEWMNPEFIPFSDSKIIGFPYCSFT